MKLKSRFSGPEEKGGEKKNNKMKSKRWRACWLSQLIQPFQGFKRICWFEALVALLAALAVIKQKQETNRTAFLCNAIKKFILLSFPGTSHTIEGRVTP